MRKKSSGRLELVQEEVLIMRKVWTCSTRIGARLAFAVVCGMLAFPESALAQK